MWVVSRIELGKATYLPFRARQRPEGGTLTTSCKLLETARDTSTAQTSTAQTTRWASARMSAFPAFLFVARCAWQQSSATTRDFTSQDVNLHEATERGEPTTATANRDTANNHHHNIITQARTITCQSCRRLNTLSLSAEHPSTYLEWKSSRTRPERSKTATIKLNMTRFTRSIYL